MYTKPKPQYTRVVWHYWQHLKRHPVRVSVIVVSIVAANLASAISPIYLKQLVDILTSAPTVDLYAAAIGVLSTYIGIKVLQVILNRTGFWNIAYADIDIMTSLRQFGFTRLIQHSHAFFTNSFSGSLTQKISKFARSFEIIFDTIMMQIIPLILWIGISLYVVSRFSLTIAGILAAGIASFIGFNIVFVYYKLKYDRASSEADTKLTAGLADNISNHATIQLFTASKYEDGRIIDLTQKLRRAKIAQWNRGEVLFGTQAVIFVFVEYFVFKYSIAEWQLGLLTAGTIVLFQIYIIGLLNRLFEFANVFRRLSESFSDAQEMIEILDKPLEVTDTAATIETPPTIGTIEFKNTDFAYHDGQDLIGNLSLSIKKGEKVALVGVSGAGKSTLFKLLLRLYDRTGGELLIDGMPIESYTQEAMRGGIGFVPQEPSLFHRSLRENIRYGRRDATEEEVRQAAKAAECLDFIEKLPQGFDTLVGERGVKLSGGERQRVAIARAILKNAPILLLDEATSALDSHSELEIQRALERLMADKTVVAIAHRLSTIKKMDRIILLENGKIVEEGTHDSLLEKENGIYRKLWELQVGGFIAD